MTTYDYRNHGYLELDYQYDELSNEERRRLNEAIKEIRQQTQQEAEEQARKWLYEAVVPILKNYAEASESMLLIEDKGSAVIASLVNDVGFNMLDTKKRLKMVLGLADHAEIMRDEKGVRMELTYSWDGMK